MAPTGFPILNVANSTCGPRYCARLPRRSDCMAGTDALEWKIAKRKKKCCAGDIPALGLALTMDNRPTGTRAPLRHKHFCGVRLGLCLEGPPFHEAGHISASDICGHRLAYFLEGEGIVRKRRTACRPAISFCFVMLAGAAFADLQDVSSIV